MATQIDEGPYRERYEKMQKDMKRVCANLKSMEDEVLWKFLRSLAYKSSQHWDMREVPADVASSFVIEFHDGKR